MVEESDDKGHKLTKEGFKESRRIRKLLPAAWVVFDLLMILNS